MVPTDPETTRTPDPTGTPDPDPTRTPDPDPTRAPVPTRDRILDAAREEFAAHGFAGARVERIAEAANINKERLYAYFGAKRGLFVAAMASAIREIGEHVNREADDLADFAARMFDFIGAHPANLRLLTWARLEGDDFWRETHGLLDSAIDPVTLIGTWQATGAIDAAWSADDLFVAILGLCEIWHVTPFIANTSEAVAAQRRRALVVHIARTLSEAPRPAPAPSRPDDTP